jgi:hypothetical protein
MAPITAKRPIDAVWDRRSPLFQRLRTSSGFGHMNSTRLPRPLKREISYGSGQPAGTIGCADRQMPSQHSVPIYTAFMVVGGAKTTAVSPARELTSRRQRPLLRPN